MRKGFFLIKTLCFFLLELGGRILLMRGTTCQDRGGVSYRRSAVTLLTFMAGPYAVVSNANPVRTLGDMALTITYSFYGLSKLITAGAYMAGMGFVMASMLKFKAHKDNPTQIPIGTPIALLFVGSALIFLPHIFTIAGETVFGGTSGSAGIYGTTGLSIN